MQQPSFHPSEGLRIDTSVAVCWASGPSSTPMSSSPNTPSPYPSEYMASQSQPTYYGGEMPQQLDELQGLPVDMFQPNCVQQQWVQPAEEYYYAHSMYANPTQVVTAEQDPVYQKYADISDPVYPQTHSYISVAHPYTIHTQ